MKDRSFERTHPEKQKAGRSRTQPAADGPRGAALWPPAYGIDFVDQANRRPADGLPEGLRWSVERLAGRPLPEVTVHYRSAEPARVGALAFTRGSEIHLAPGQEKHLPHEAWHVVQQQAGRVRPTAAVEGRPLNDDARLEAEATRMGHLAHNRQSAAIRPQYENDSPPRGRSGDAFAPIQRYVPVESVEFQNDQLDNPPAGWAARKAEWIPRFSAVQQFLHDIKRTRPLLDQLNEGLKQQPLTDILASQAVEMGWQQELPKLVEGVPAESFIDLVGRGFLFEDWVEDQHGVQSHRVQWYLIQKQFPETALDLYREVVHSDWVDTEGKTMWDRVVDSTHRFDDFDFTHPATLERYLDTSYRSPLLWKNRLSAAIKAGKASFYPQKDTYSYQARLLEQKEEPDGPHETAEGRWDGWRKFAGVWRPTIYYPN